jgi:SAM-dependent methyltransferase
MSHSDLKRMTTRALGHTLHKLRNGGGGERVSPDCPDKNFESHKKVYEFAAQFVDGKDVLDCGSGAGYGAALLIENGARSAVGIDYSDEAISSSQARYQQPNLSYLKMDAQDIQLADGSLDFVITTENLEHLPRPEDNIAEIHRILRPGGLVLVATPNKEVSSPGLDTPTNPWHIKEFTYEELRDLLQGHFGEVRIFESSLPSKRRIGRKMKADRVERGVVGIDGTVGGVMDLNGLKADLTHLHNTHSFLALAWQPR